MVHRLMERLARAMAIAGGLVLVFLILLTCLSVLGRTLNGVLHGPVEAIAPGLANWLLGLGVGPINGDFELVEAGVAFAIFAFLPYCQITGGHASVDIFTARLPERAKRVLRLVIEVVFALVLVLIAWKLYDGMQSKLSYGETTYLLQFPIWWAYGASLAGAVVASVVGVYMAGVRAVECLRGATMIADGPEADPVSSLEIGLASFPALLILIFLRVPIGLAMFLVGLVGLSLVTGGTTIAFAKLKSETFSTFSSYSLSIVPMFLLMGHFATLGGLSNRLFKAAESWLGHRRGGVAMAAVGACAGFGAICGSSLATAATMSRVALPELRRYGYAGGFSTATLAAGGTLGILIPPSVVLVIYAILTEQNIAKLFLAAFVPGILAAVGYVIVISIYVRLYPKSAGTRAPVPYGERVLALIDVWPVLLVFALVVGGIYLGWFTPTEGAAVGAFGTGLIALVNRGLTLKTLIESFLVTARSTAMVFFIILGAAFYNGFLALTQVPQEISAYVVGQGFGAWTVLTLILIFYLIFGCLMDSLSMILLTIPIFFPVIAALDFGMSPEHVAIWFGILVLIVVEVGLITPPVGMNLFVINAMDRSTPMLETYKAVLFFVASDLVRVTILAVFPAITLFLIAG